MHTAKQYWEITREKENTLLMKTDSIFEICE